MLSINVTMSNRLRPTILLPKWDVGSDIENNIIVHLIFIWVWNLFIVRAADAFGTITANSETWWWWYVTTLLLDTTTWTVVLVRDNTATWTVVLARESPAEHQQTFFSAISVEGNKRTPCFPHYHLPVLGLSTSFTIFFFFSGFQDVSLKVFLWDSSFSILL